MGTLHEMLIEKTLSVFSTEATVQLGSTVELSLSYKDSVKPCQAMYTSATVSDHFLIFASFASWDWIDRKSDT